METVLDGNITGECADPQSSLACSAMDLAR